MFGCFMILDAATSWKLTCNALSCLQLIKKSAALEAPLVITVNILMTINAEQSVYDS